ncbi:endonuclease [Atopomonas sediminilitoris]|uniref:endonuclease n=1 Tax=Atopomonas sediminilitoris TaxID=2919919 RepID=UPI001F4ECB88|nr:endonuclease [Atopomonas sediminilitoris]MCJ8168286.1 endonuclease [Atopomonas sediminilitoris]
MRYWLLFLTCCYALLTPTTHAEPRTFSEAKRLLPAISAGLGQRSFYCDCAITRQGKKLIPDWHSCGYEPRKNANRAARIEWEHVVPAWEFGHQLQCWQQGGRQACNKDPRFRRMEADLHNLVPAIGEVNGDRSNHPFGLLPNAPAMHGACPIRIDFKARRVQPPADKRGDIARIYFYMRDRYGLNISRQQTQLFTAWAKRDPVDAPERARDARIAAAIGWHNTQVFDQYDEHIARQR